MRRWARARLQGVAVVIALGHLLPASTAAADERATAREPVLKAAFVYNFMKFTTWPEVSDPSRPVIIAVLGDELVGASLVAQTRNRTLHGRPIEVLVMRSAPAPADVSVLYVAASQDKALSEISSTFGTPGLLTIGESDLFASSGGIIRLAREDDRIQFDIDVASAQKAGLTLSSQLLALARQVRGQPARP